MVAISYVMVRLAGIEPASPETIIPLISMA